MPLPTESHAWRIACAWSLARRERSPLQAVLLEAIWASPEVQERALAPLVPAGLVPPPHLGGVTLEQVAAAASPDVRAGALELLAAVFEDAGLESAARARAVAAAHPIDQLVALWEFWTDALPPSLFALVALTRAVVLGQLDPGEQRVVGLRHLGLV
jgi:hypothetical protein